MKKTTFILFVAIILSACNTSNPADKFNQQFGKNQEYELQEGSAMEAYAENDQQNFNPSEMTTAYSAAESVVGSEVTLMDRGLGIAYATMVVPQNWKVNQDIATDLSSAAYARFRIDLEGPNQTFSRSLGNLTYNTMFGQNAQGAWQYLLQRGMNDFSDIQWGQMRQDTEAMNKPENQENIEKLRQRGLTTEKLVTTFTGKFRANAISGVAEISHFSGREFGFVSVLLFTSPSGSDLTTARKEANAIWNTSKFNPAHDAAIGQLINGQTQQIENNTAQMTRDHNQRMADQKQNFEAHQQKMNGIYESNDRQNAAWMNNQRGTPSYSNSSEYGNHERFIDQQYERTTLTDEQTGYDVHQDGQYNYWYTNGDGKYYGTDDINFDPQKLGNDWHETQPRKP